MTIGISSAHFYSEAKHWAIANGFLPEILWQQDQSPEKIEESDFLREAAWVIYCSGFKESVVRKHFDFIGLCFFDWESAQSIAKNAESCISSAMLAIGYHRKHKAITEIAARIANSGFRDFKASLLLDPIPLLEELPYIGQVTAWHLAKNLGFNVAKPDRHLVRLQNQFGFSTVSQMCSILSEMSGDSIKVVDLVLWRFCEQNRFSQHGCII